jgi:hypothetical protein
MNGGSRGITHIAVSRVGFDDRARSCGVRISRWLHRTLLAVDHGKNLAVAFDDETHRRQGVAMRPGDLAGLDHLDAHEQRVRRPAHRHTVIIEQQTAPRRDALFEHIAGFSDFSLTNFHGQCSHRAASARCIGSASSSCHTR